jgi:hypothetical protein
MEGQFFFSKSVSSLAKAWAFEASTIPLVLIYRTYRNAHYWSSELNFFAHLFHSLFPKAFEREQGQFLRALTNIIPCRGKARLLALAGSTQRSSHSTLDSP